MSEYSYRVLIICVNKEAGNALANLAASFPSDPGAELGTFTDARMLALASDPTTPVAWYAEIPSKASMAGVIQAMKDRVPYSDERLAYLVERGLTYEQWAMSDVIFPYVDVYDTTDGYSPDAMADLATSAGYVIVEVPDDE